MVRSISERPCTGQTKNVTASPATTPMSVLTRASGNSEPHSCCARERDDADRDADARHRHAPAEGDGDQRGKRRRGADAQEARADQRRDAIPASMPTIVPLTRLPEVARSSPTLVPTISAAVKVL